MKVISVAPRAPSKKPSSHTTPLWIISVFVGMSEIVAGTTVINTTGAVQIILVIFMCVFTSSVAGVFFYILITRSEVLFPPSEYIGVDIETYVRNVSGRRAEREKVIVQQVTEKIEQKVDKDLTSDKSKANFQETIDELRREFVKIVFPCPEFSKRTEISFELFTEGWDSVSDFLNEIYLVAVENEISIPIWSYGKYWELKNTRTNAPIKKQAVGHVHDKRPFRDIGLLPGDILVAKLL